MKLTVQVRLLPGAAQEAALQATLNLANQVATSSAQWIGSQVPSVTTTSSKSSTVKSMLGRSAELGVRAIKKVAEACNAGARWLEGGGR